ncbi:MAG: hypothetical protein NC926_04985 [Candidatus Omnitrophica bacterium]|nr:hypothetical protein [Candidatus Omnitrophota bacterium]MCM8807295.1 hypothetical protein [Candidatus Omnitrophota bacterium]
MKKFFLVLLFILFILEADEIKLPEGYGISQNYPGDKNIEKDENVIFFEDFEIKSLDELKNKWEDIRNIGIMSLSEDIPPKSFGKYSLLMTHIGGNGTGGHLYKRLLPGYEQLFFRFYVKFDSKCYPIHHFFHVGGYNPSTPWPQGKAGEKPNGNERFTIGIEPYGKDWRWDYYVYWMDMRGSPPEGKTWGNSFINNSALKVEKDKWICIELMVKMNEPVNECNGELALWIDGKLKSYIGKGFPKGIWIYDKFIPDKGGKSICWNYEKNGPDYFYIPEGGLPFEGFRWRKDEKLKLNFIWVLLYITKAPYGYISKVWFDNIVVAKKYIGPIK